MMIAIVILGLGLVMVATIFPVAWDRARTLSDYTVEQAASSGAHATLSALLRPAGHSLAPRKAPLPKPPSEELQLTAGSLAGDMFFDPTLAHPQTPTDPEPPRQEWYKAILAYSDTSVHALNVENMLVTPDNPAENPLGLAAEKPWDLEDPTDLVQARFVYPNSRDFPNPNYPRNRGLPFPDRLFYGGDNCLTPQGGTPQVRVWQRLYPPMEAPPAPGLELDQWNEKLATRRFCWAVLHRLRTRVGPAPLAFGTPVQPWQSDGLVREAAAAMGTTRTFDMYYVTLRRSKSTNRYARQDPTPAKIPNPFSFVRPVLAVEPAALPSDNNVHNDVVFPVAWRVQMQFPGGLAYRGEALKPNPNPALLPTGIPTEITVPPPGVAGPRAAMLVQMFPGGTQFIDEITGTVYRVVKRRIVDDNGEQSVLTLDREVVLEDINLPLPDPRCELCTPIDPTTPAADPEELLRTVWVFPPPVDRSQPGGETTPTPTFDGPSPVVDIEVGTLSISPSS